MAPDQTRPNFPNTTDERGSMDDEEGGMDRRGGQHGLMRRVAWTDEDGGTDKDGGTNEGGDTDEMNGTDDEEGGTDR